MLPACLVVFAMLPLGFAQSPVGGAGKPAPTTPGPAKVDGRYDTMFGDERVTVVTTPDAPAIPDTFHTRTEPCFQASHERQPEKGGRVDLAVTIQAGALTHAVVVKSSLGDILLSECLVARATGLSLAGLPDGTWTWGLVVDGANASATP